MPWSMFIPHAKAISLVFGGVNSIVTASLRGNELLMFKDGKTTSVPQVLSVVLTNVRRAGAPARRVILAGSNPCSLTITLALWILDAACGRFVISSSVTDIP